MKKILIINGHPNKDSLCTSLAMQYKSGAETSGADCKIIHLADMQFDPILHKGFSEIQELEPDLEQVQKEILWADHIVLVFPNWWGTYPALLKGFFDRIILPGFAFKYHEGKAIPEKLLKGKTARLITTMDTPGWYYRWIYKSVGTRAVKKNVLEFCGIGPVKSTYFRTVRDSSEGKRAQWLVEAELLGKQQA